jgi:hypothetical protein
MMKRKVVVFGLVLVLLGLVTIGVFSQVGVGTRVNLRIVNNTGYTLVGNYISVAGDPSWGPYIQWTVGGRPSPLYSGQSDIFPIWVTSFRADIRVVDVDGDTYSKYNVSVTDGATITFTMADFDRR